MENVTGFITHQKGSWRWQDRFELAEYAVVFSPRTKRFIYKKVRTINDRVTPGRCGAMIAGHNRPASAEHVWQVYGITA